MELTETTGLLESHPRGYKQQQQSILPTTITSTSNSTSTPTPTRRRLENEKYFKSFSFYFASGLTILLFILFITFSRTILSSSPLTFSQKHHHMLKTQGDPLTTDPNGNILRSISHPMTPSTYWGVVKKPYPTGAFWTNLVVDNGNGAVAVLPYGVKCVQEGVQISYGPTRRSVTNKWIRDSFDVDLQISTVQPYSNRGVSSYDEISVTMSYEVSGGFYKAILIKGSPFLTISYQGSTPMITSTIMHITAMDAYHSTIASSIGGLVYIVTLGNYQKWLIYCSDAAAPLVWSGDTIVASSPTHGIIRVGILPTTNTVQQIDSLLPYLPTYPTGIDIDIQYSTQGKQTTSTLQYKFKIGQINANNNQLLMLALPHHMDIITNPNKNDPLHLKLKSILNPIWTIKGKMTPIIGNFWTIQYTLLNPGLVYDLEGRVIPTSNLNAIGQALQFDVLTIPPFAVSPYTFGKQCSRLANLAIIADNLGIADARQNALTKMENSLTSWLVQTNEDALVYDSIYGGIVPTKGVNDKQADYGSGWYNDHHFHYGYFVHTSAVLIHLDNNYYQTHKLLFDSLVKDICNNDKKNVNYPYVRHKDFFDGHSWASGLIQQANGKGQESSSEAVNAYYAVKLYADALNDVELSHFAQLMLTMEIQAVKYYWHVRNYDIYDQKLGSSRMIGNVGGFDVTTSTWFGSNLEYVHGINIVPVSPVTALLFDHAYIDLEWPVVEKVIPPPRPPFVIHQECQFNEKCVALGITGTCCPTPDDIVLACCDGASGDDSTTMISDEWASLLFAVHAVNDQKTAWDEMLSVTNFGVGNSRSNSLYWVASRPILPPKPKTPLNDTTPLLSTRSCSANSACDAAGMIGDCCPTSGGVFLGCCPVDITS